VTAIRLEDLPKIGLVMKRAKYFISLGGRKAVQPSYSYEHVVEAMQTLDKPKKLKRRKNHQLRLF
jgi:predicted DNA-binding helix-hairpin-helix protein